MNKKIIGFVLFILLIITSLPVTGKNVDHNKINNQINTNDLLEGGWLEERNGIKILHISGSNYEMGYQLGYLIKEEYLQNRRAFLHHVHQDMGASYEDLLNIWNETKEYVPQEYIEEMLGRADALNLAFEEVAIMDTLNLVLFPFKKEACTGLAAWGPATSDGKLYHVRSHDCSLNTICDPVTGTPAYKNEFLIVRNPDNGYASVSPTTIVDVGVEGGFNEKGICISYKSSTCEDVTIYGTPSTIRQLMVLDHASNLEEAVKIINSNTTIGLNFIISDGNKSEAVAVEQSANHTYVGTWNNSVESTSRFWAIDHVVRRGNCFIDPVLSSTQKKIKYNQNILLVWLFSPVFKQYVSLSKSIEINWGSLDLNRSMDMIRSEYKYRFDIIHLIKRIMGLTGVWDQWVACPQTGEMVVSFAQNGKNAYDSPIIYVNLSELLEPEPNVK